MIRPPLTELWSSKIREWRDKIEKIYPEPGAIKVGTQFTHKFPDLYGDLRICSTGYTLN